MLQRDALQWNSGLNAYDASRGGMAQTITNVAAGRISKDSTDAVNGGQLFSTNSSVASLSTAITTGGSGVLSLSTGLGETNNAVASLSTGVAGLRLDALQWDSVVGAYSASHGNGVPNRITNVAAGTVSATSTDAINGSQLYAVASTTLLQITSLSTGLLQTNNSVTQLSTSVSQLSAGQPGSGGTVASLSTGLSMTSSSVASLSTGLSTTNSSVASLSTGLSSTGSVIATLTSNVISANSSIASLSTGLISAVSTVTQLSTGLNNTNSSVAALATSVANGEIGAVRYGTSPQNAQSASTAPNDLYLQPGSGTGPVVLHNVAAGKIAAGSTDAINGGQMLSLGNSLATALGGGATFNTASGEISAPTYRVQGSNYTNVGGAISALDSGLMSLQNNMSQVTAHLQTQITRNRSIASGGVAAAFAMSQMRFSDRPGTQSIGLGTGYYDNQGAMAIGYGFTSEDGAWRGTASLSYTPGVNKVGVAGGLSYSW